MDEIVSKVTKIISEQLGKDESEINLESHFIDDLDADSLDTVELVWRWKKNSASTSQMTPPKKSLPSSQLSTSSDLLLADPLSPSSITLS